MNDRTAEVQRWNEMYEGNEHRWSGQANTALVSETADLSPGRVLDLGSGEGGDALWFAARGWQVTAVDLSAVALERARTRSAEAGLDDRIQWRELDLATDFPDGEYDLVSAQFLHSWGDLPREEVLRKAADAVAPGGTLLVESHCGVPAWETDPHPDVHFPTPQEVLDALHLPEGQWDVQVCAEHERTQTGPDGTDTTRIDSTVKIRRLP
ncbi:class I SAM-dependent methyltransferase [Saccharopolyspora sp. NFXS83]|uniref:SAM-dependent methyltransferase n=1 Tax=Saccharopolyspora sp. NFXS83 TaxID=2993560 RepID=UPI00224B6390|nr:class I SAM-dependent methyltransferase [Saccharopolyspora sp. NFXS83]MCX2732648.1 class I SAM-dependent methyltransferase [Saccharopolyspora sp. NFXS83]